MKTWKTIAVVAATTALVGASSAGAAKLITGGQIKNSTITGVDVKNHSLTSADFRGSLTGARGAPGATGSPGAPGASGPVGATGPQGVAGPFPDGNAPSGKTFRGTYALASEGTADLAFTGISYGFQFATAPVTHVIQAAGVTPANCTGNATNPGAAPGHLCVFEVAGTNHTTTYPVVFNTTRFGSTLYMFATAAGFAYSSGTWAATSP